MTVFLRRAAEMSRKLDEAMNMPGVTGHPNSEQVQALSQAIYANLAIHKALGAYTPAQQAELLGDART